MPWIRIIDPETEFKTLSIREKLTDEALAAQQFRCPKSNEHVAKINFTPASAFQFFTNGVKQHFFADDPLEEPIYFGVILNRAATNRNVMFRDSMRGEVSDSIFKSPLTEEQFEEQLKDNRFIRTTERDASEIVKRTLRELVEQHKKEGFDPVDVSLNWTEGLFRHKFSDIDSIYINQNEKSIRDGYAFAKVLESITEKRFTFHTWDEESAKLIECDRGKMKEALGFTIDQKNPSKQNIDRETQLKIREFRSYFEEAQKGGR